MDYFGGLDCWYVVQNNTFEDVAFAYEKCNWHVSVQQVGTVIASHDLNSTVQESYSNTQC